MKQLKKYCVGMLLLMTLLFVTACSRNSNADNTDTDNAGTAGTGNTAGNVADTAGGSGLNVDDILFDTDGDGVYDHADVDRDGLLETIGSDSNDMVGDLTDDAVGEGDAAGLDGTVGANRGSGAVTP